MIHMIYLNKVKANIYLISCSTANLWLNFLQNWKHSLGFALLPIFNSTFASESCSPCIFCTVYFLQPCLFCSIARNCSKDLQHCRNNDLILSLLSLMTADTKIFLSSCERNYSVSHLVIISMNCFPEPTSQHFRTFVLCCIALFTDVKIEATSSLLVAIVFITR